jgi:predicted  nucleic acid-binding Zn-ribbon protein
LEEQALTIDVGVLKIERDRLKESLRDLENELRRIEAEQKKARQREIQAKRKIEALDTLIDVEQSAATEG